MAAGAGGAALFLLREAGHQVYTPTLTGLGERAHLLRPDIDLDTHIADVVGVLRYEGCTDVVLVGHGYGGMVITGVADRAAEQVERLVYLDAAIPEDGQFLVAVAGMLMAAARAGSRVVDGVELVPWPELPPTHHSVLQGSPSPSCPGMVRHGVRNVDGRGVRVQGVPADEPRQAKARPE